MSLYNDMFLEDTDKLDNEEHEIDMDASEESVVESEYADYISKNFLNGFLSEDYSAISKRLAEIQTSNTLDESKLLEVMEGLFHSNIGSELKLHVLENAINTYKSWNEAEVVVEETTILNEYDNPAKTKIMRQLISEMEKGLADYYDECIFCIDTYAKMHKIINKGKSVKDANGSHKILAEVKALYDKFDAKLSTQEYKDYVKNYGLIFNRLKAICNKFSIKFSDVAIEDKKAFDKRLEQAYDKLYKDSSFQFMFPKSENNIDPRVKEINDGLDQIGIYDKNNQLDIVKYLQPIYNWTFQACEYYFGNINFIRRNLKLEKEDRPFFKILNKILKTKKN